MSAGDGGYLLLVGEQQYGPYSADDLQAGLREGWARPDHLVWRPGLTDWTTLQQALGLPPALPPPPPRAPVEAEVPRRRGLRPWLLGCLVACGVVTVTLAVALAARSGWIGAVLDSGDRPEPYDLETIYDTDNGDWRAYPDLKVELKAIAQRQSTLVQALRAGDVESAAAFICPEDQSVWTTRTRAEPALGAALADALDTSVISFLSSGTEVKDDPRSRTAGFVVSARGRRFEIVWIKLDGDWYLYRY